MQTGKYKSDMEMQAEMLAYLKDISSSMHKERRTPFFDFDYIDNAELIKLLHISNATAKNWRNHGTLLYYKLGGKIYYRISDLERTLGRAINKRS
jgi:hypothetical protein